MEVIFPYRRNIEHADLLLSHEVDTNKHLIDEIFSLVMGQLRTPL
ncbi:MAG: hypothetical protein PUI38_02235 [Candidatus Treponema excrementipullorum]|nr:hypothetical protein [Candidatus Treponema excrementipullorum]MDY4708420.1 hypothetical protein [Candidatus Treponema excrementipullorum]